MVQEVDRPATDEPMVTDMAQSRVVIEQITPELDGGRFPIKAIVGNSIAVEADIFSNGTDKIVARLRYRHTDELAWREAPMTFLGSNRWGAAFTAERPGRYRYAIEAWIDPLASWQHTIKTKIEAGQRVTDELATGANYADWLAQKTRGEDKKELKTLARIFRSANRYDEAVSRAQSQDFSDLNSRYADRRYGTQTHELAVDVARPKAQFSTWYCLSLQSVPTDPNGGSVFRNLEGLLPRMAELGFDVLCLLPLRPLYLSSGSEELLEDQPLNEPGFPYGIGPDPGESATIWTPLGTLEDFKHLVAIARNYDIELALDLLVLPADYPHLSPNSSPVTDSAADWQRVVQVVLTWAQWGVRIIRVDKPHTRPFPFWERVIAEVKKTYPDMLFLAASITENKPMLQLSKRGFDQAYTYYTWCNTKHELQAYLQELTQQGLSDYFRPNFWPATPDINPYCLQLGHEAQFMIRYFLAATLSSNCGIYGPLFEQMEHAAMPGKEEFLPNEKDEIRQWDWSRTNKLTYLITLVNRIRRDNPALQVTNNLSFCRIDDDALMAYLKVTDTNRLLLVVNTDAYNRRAGMVQVPILELGIASWQEYVVHDLLTGAQYTWKGEWNYVELDPYLLPMHLLKIEV